MQKSTLVQRTGTNFLPKEFPKGVSFVAVLLATVVDYSSEGSIHKREM